MSGATGTSHKREMGIAIALVWATLLYNLVEAGIAIGSGFVAHSIALVGFGLDSLIELSASAVMLWHLRRVAGGMPDEEAEEAEEGVKRFIGITFVLLALYIAVKSGLDLFQANKPEESTVGIILAIVSLIAMPLIALQKIRIADHLGNAALRAEAKETLACAWLSFTLLVGLVLNAWLGWWWADPVAALAMLPWLVREGLEGIRGEEDDD